MAPKKKQKKVKEEPEEETYEVEKILDSRKKGKGYEYYVKWKGFSASANTWEPASHLSSCAEMISEYNTKKNSKPAAPPPLKTATRSAPLPERKPPEPRVTKRKAEPAAEPEPKKAKASPAPKEKAPVIDVTKLAKLVAAELNTPSKLRALGAKDKPTAKGKPAPKPAPKKSKADVVEVEKIVAIRSGKKGVEYQILWKGTGKKNEMTWEPEDNVMDDDLIDEFEAGLQAKTFGSVDIGVGAKVEVRSLDDGFENSWSEAKVSSKKGNKYTVEFTAFVDAKGKKMTETVERARLRPTQRGAPSGWVPEVGEVIEVSDDDCWWEARVQSIKGKAAKVMFRVSDEVKDVSLGAKVRPCAWLKMAAPGK